MIKDGNILHYAGCKTYRRAMQLLLFSGFCNRLVVSVMVGQVFAFLQAGSQDVSVVKYFSSF
jgi:hypothetical protein